MELFRYLLVGIANTVVGIGIIYLSMYFLHFNIVESNALGYIIGILFSFLLNKKWTFKSNDKIPSSFIRFLLIMALAYCANLETVLFSVDKLDLNPYIAQALGVFPYTAIGYFGCRYFGFKKQQPVNGAMKLHKANNQNSLITINRPIHLSIVVPCYNEEKVLTETMKQLTELLEGLIKENRITSNSQIYYVDDGSIDKTWPLIEYAVKTHTFIRGIKLSRNQGHQNALLSGLLTADGEAIISLDADLQDDLSAIKKMIIYYIEGFDIVYGVRDKRKKDTFFKKFFAQIYYRLLNSMGVEIIYNHADYRLMSRVVIEALREFGEVNLFLRGIIPQLGFSRALVYYDRAERYAGESKYPLSKMFSLAWEGITSFSNVPLRFITRLGVIVSTLSFLITLWAIAIRFFTEEALPGWASTVLPIYFIGGVQLLCLGIIGEYQAKIYLETKRRPRYIIQKII